MTNDRQHKNGLVVLYAETICVTLINLEEYKALSYTSLP